MWLEGHVAIDGWVPRMTAFPTTQATWLVRTVSENPAAARVFVLDRYFHPLCAYVRSSQLRALGEPADLVNDFLAARLGDDAYLVRWSASGLPLRRWLANGLLIHTRNTVLAARRRRELLSRDVVAQEAIASDSVSAEDVSNARNSPAHETDALLALERAWAIRAVTEAHERIRTELQAEGRAAWWELFRLHTIHAMAYAKAAPAVGIPLSSASSVHRQVVDRLREALVDILSRDGVGPDEVERELALMQDLLG